MNERELLVLVVEPERPLAALFQLDLAQHGHRVSAVHSGEHALEVLTPQYDLVVTSLELPEMSGEQFILKLRAQAGCADLPVLVIAPDAELPESLRDGATHLRRKPFALDHFVRYATAAAGPARFPN